MVNYLMLLQPYFPPCTLVLTNANGALDLRTSITRVSSFFFFIEAGTAERLVHQIFYPTPLLVQHVTQSLNCALFCGDGRI